MKSNSLIRHLPKFPNSTRFPINFSQLKNIRQLKKNGRVAISFTDVSIFQFEL